MQYVRHFSSAAIVFWLILFSVYGNGTILDFNGDGRSDLAVYNPADGRWYIEDITNDDVLAWHLSHGYPGAECVSGDFNGDSETDLGVYEPRTGRWYIRTLSGEVILWGAQWGFATGEPVVADFNGDGSDDLGIYDTASNSWFVRSVSGEILYWLFQWGYPGCEPLAGVYAGTSATPTVFDDKLGRFWIPNQTERNVFNFDSEAEPVTGDYNGDGLTDLAAYDPSVGFWQVWQNDFLTEFIEWGFVGGVPLPGNYDGDNTSDFAVYDKGLWYIRGSDGSIIKWNHNWGSAGFVPVGRRMANPTVDTSTIRFTDASSAFNMIYISVENMERGTTRNPAPNTTITLQPGWHRATVVWYGSTYQGGAEWFLPGTNIYNISVEPRRTYNYRISGGSINPPKAVAPDVNFTEN